MFQDILYISFREYRRLDSHITTCHIKGERNQGVYVLQSTKFLEKQIKRPFDNDTIPIPVPIPVLPIVSHSTRLESRLVVDENLIHGLPLGFLPVVLLRPYTLAFEPILDTVVHARGSPHPFAGVGLRFS